MVDAGAGRGVGGQVSYREPVFDHIVPCVQVNEGKFVPGRYILRQGEPQPVHLYCLSGGEGVYGYGHVVG